jgi:hypothetical protein
VSCDIFEEHPIFGFSQCRRCAVAKAHHFDANALAIGDSDILNQHDGSDKGRERYSDARHARPGASFALPTLELHREGWLFVRKKAQRFGEWKRRCALTVVLQSLFLLLLFRHFRVFRASGCVCAYRTPVPSRTANLAP